MSFQIIVKLIEFKGGVFFGKSAFFWTLTCSINRNSNSNVFIFDFWTLLARLSIPKNFRGYPGGPSATFGVVLKGGVFFAIFIVSCSMLLNVWGWVEQQKRYLMVWNTFLYHWIRFWNNLYGIHTSGTAYILVDVSVIFFSSKKSEKMQLHLKNFVVWSKRALRTSRV